MDSIDIMPGPNIGPPQQHIHGDWYPNTCRSSVNILVIIIICVILIILMLPYLLHAQFCRNRQHRPPSPWQLPVLGNLHQLLLCMPLLPHQALAKLAKRHGPLMYLYLGSRPALFISSSAMAEAFFQANDGHFASRPRFAFCDRLLYGQHNGVAFSMYGPRWRRMRRICTLELFTAKRITSFHKVFEEELALIVKDVGQLCECSIDGSVKLNIACLAHLVVSNIMGRLVLSKRMCDTYVNGESLVDMFSKTNDAIVPAMTDFLPSILGFLLDFRSKQKMSSVHKHIDAFWTAILEERRHQRCHKCGDGDHPWRTSAPAMDFLDVLLSNEEVVELGDDNIKATLMDILGAGSETSSITIEWAMAELLRNPHCIAKLQSELDGACPTMEVLWAPSPLPCPILGSRWAHKHVLSPPPSYLSSSSSSAILAAAPQLVPLRVSSPSSMASCPSVAYSRAAQAAYLKAVVKETLRLHPPVPLLIPRGSTAEARSQFGEYTFAGEVMLFVNAWAIGRDGEVWRDPEEFQPERLLCHGIDENGATAVATHTAGSSSSSYQMLPFGAGRRRCPGMALALRIMELTVATFVRAFEWELPNGQALSMDDMREKSGSAGTHKAMPLIAVLRRRAT